MKVEDMDVFKLAHQLTLQVYKLTEIFPAEERFGLISQMRRSAASVPTNLTEGGYRLGKNEYRHFISISRGSCGEIKYQLLLSKDLGYVGEETYADIREGYDRISMMLTKLHGSLK